MWDFAQTVDAAFALADMVWGPDLYWNIRGSEPRKPGQRSWLSDTRLSIPVYGPGALGTTGGLSIHTYMYFPVWIETPWGEWNCWGTRPTQFGPPRVLERFRASLQVDEERSKRFRVSGMEIIALQRVGEILLPPYEQCRISHQREEWADLCRQHEPPHPVAPYWERMTK
jgi:hypothetical protein